MTDLVQRLRRLHDVCAISSDEGNLFAEAADALQAKDGEIGRLREALNATSARNRTLARKNRRSSGVSSAATSERPASPETTAPSGPQEPISREGDAERAAFEAWIENRFGHASVSAGNILSRFPSGEYAKDLTRAAWNAWAESARGGGWRTPGEREASPTLPHSENPDSPAPRGAQGWRMVPVEPTDEMIEAGYEALEQGREWGRMQCAPDVWEAMLAAAPDAGQEEAGQ